jgi:DNA-binding NtrC family response regulator
VYSLTNFSFRSSSIRLRLSLEHGMTARAPSRTPNVPLLEALGQLRVSRCVLDELATLIASDVWLFDATRGDAKVVTQRAGRLAPCLGARAATRPRWPTCLQPTEAPGWETCAGGEGRHLVARVGGPSGVIGWMVTGAVHPPALVADVAARLLAIVAEEMGRYAEHRRTLEIAAPGELSEIVGVSVAIEEVRAELRRVIPAPYPVLIEGETGTGKDLAAWCIHHRGPREKGRYVAVNCAAMPETLLESTLFGHRRGAFTGALRDEPGLLVAARGGTIFLDEVAELSLGAQAKLLRAIESGDVLPVGATHAAKTDARILAATNADLEVAAAERRFRPDLLYRLRVLSVRMPPLRERPEDIPHLASHVLRQIGERLGVLLLGFTDDALAALVAAPWLGNVRELIHEIERAAVRCEGARIELAHLSAPLRRSGATGRTAVPSDFLARGRAVHETWEHDNLERSLIAADWNVAQAATALGISRRTLFNRIKAFGLERPRRT